MSIIQRNNLDIYDDVAADWWSDDIRWVRTLKTWCPGDWGGSIVTLIGLAKLCWI